MDDLIYEKADKKELLLKLSFLVGKTIIFRDGDDSYTSTIVNAIKVDGNVQVHFISSIGVQTIKSSEEFKNIFIWFFNGNNMQPLKEITDEKQIKF